MATNTINSRIQLKNDTEVNWNKAVNFIPKKGEVIIYSADDAHPFSRIKVGDGLTLVSNLPFIDAATLNGKKIIIDTKANLDVSGYIPNNGDILFYLDKDILGNGNLVPGVKIGNGSTYCVNLPFMGDDIAEDLLTHIGNTNVHITSAERLFWNNKINCEDTVVNGLLILKRN